MINTIEIELDELKEDNNILCLPEAARQVRGTELQASTDKFAAKLTIWTGRYDTFQENKAANIRCAREGEMVKVLVIDNERSAAVTLVKLGSKRHDKVTSRLETGLSKLKVCMLCFIHSITMYVVMSLSYAAESSTSSASSTFPASSSSCNSSISCVSCISSTFSTFSTSFTSSDSSTSSTSSGSSTSSNYCASSTYYDHHHCHCCNQLTVPSPSLLPLQSLSVVVANIATAAIAYHYRCHRHIQCRPVIIVAIGTAAIVYRCHHHQHRHLQCVDITIITTHHCNYLRLPTQVPSPPMC